MHSNEGRFRIDLTPEETGELEILRVQFEIDGRRGIYHADHTDTESKYNQDFGRYLELMGLPHPQKPAITPDGRLSREEWKTAIKKIIAEERINLLNKI